MTNHDGSNEHLLDDPIDHRPGVPLLFGGLCQCVEDTLPFVTDILQFLRLLLVYFSHQVDVLIVDLVIHQKTEIFQLAKNSPHVERLHSLDDYFSQECIQFEHLQNGLAEIETRLATKLLIKFREIPIQTFHFTFCPNLQGKVDQIGLGNQIKKIYEFLMIEQIDLIGKLYVYLLEIGTKTSYGLEHPCILLSETLESQRADLAIHVIDLHVLRLDVVGKGKLQFFQSTEGQRCFEMGQTAVLYCQSLAIFEVMYERFVIFRFVKVILVYLDIDMMVLQILSVKLLTSPKIGIDLVQLKRFLRGDENLLFLIIETWLQELFLEDLLRVFGPFEGVEVVDDFSLDLLLLLDTFLGRFEADVLKDSPQPIPRLPMSQEMLHALYVILDLAILLLPFQFMHPSPSHLLNPSQLHQIFLHLGDLLLNIQIVRCHLPLQFIEIIGYILRKKRKDVGMVMHVMPIGNAASIALGANKFLADTLRLNAIMTPLPHLALRTGLAATLDHRQHLSQPHPAEQTRLVVVGLFWETRRDEGVLDHHDLGDSITIIIQGLHVT